MAKCRDCNTCTRPGQTLINLLALGLHLSTLGITYILKRLNRHCPHCTHLLTSHNRRPDGSFHD